MYYRNKENLSVFKRKILIFLFMLISIQCYSEENLSFINGKNKFSFQGGKIIVYPGLYLNIQKTMIEKEKAYLKIKSPFDMNILHPDSVEYGANRRSLRLEYNKNPQVIKLYRGTRSTYNYEMKRINGIDYYTKLTIKFYKKNSKKLFDLYKFELKYRMEVNLRGEKVPILQKFIYQDQYDKTIYSRKKRLCPATKRVESCVVLTTADHKTSNMAIMPVGIVCYFKIIKGDYINNYTYKKHNDSMKFLAFKRFQKIGSGYKLVKERKNGKAIRLEYFDDKANDGKYYGKIKRIVYPDKKEKHYTYFSDGIIKSVKTNLK